MEIAATDRRPARPVILGSGLTGLAISRALSVAGIDHVLVGGRPTDRPRLGESLNAEGSLEAARQFPEFARFFSEKGRQAIFFGGHAIAIGSLRSGRAPAWYPSLGYPPTVRLLHVDRVGLDRALFEAATADAHCRFREGRATSVDHDPASDRIRGIRLSDGAEIVPSYVFDATNEARFVAGELGVRREAIGDARRVVFAHYRSAGGGAGRPGPWIRATSLLRLDPRSDAVDGLAWCIPLGDRASVGVSVDPGATRLAAGALLDRVVAAYRARGLDVLGAFPNRDEPIELRSEHYTHGRCSGRNWLLAGASCCQFWFPTASGVATGLVAAAMAVDILRAPTRAPLRYQAYLDRAAEGHRGMEWLARDDPRTATSDDLRRRARAMALGNARRLAGYLGLCGSPTPGLPAGSLRRMFEADRILAGPVRVDAAPPQAQASRAFAGGPDAPAEVPMPVPRGALDGPRSILGLVEVLSGRRDPGAMAELVSPDFEGRIDQFRLRGPDHWARWVAFLRGSPRVSGLILVPIALAEGSDRWTLTARWQGIREGAASASAEFSWAFAMAGDRVASIRASRADYAFAAGDSILPAVAFAALLGGLAA